MKRTRLVPDKHDELAAAGFQVRDVQTPDRGGDVTTFYCTSPGWRCSTT